MVKIIEVHVPEYNVKKKPDYLKIGKKVDKIIERTFTDGKYVVRAIGLDDHPGLSLDKLAEIIIKTGTDKYNPKRKGVAHKEFCEYNYDIQAGTFKTKNSKMLPNKQDRYPSVFGDIIYNFYENTPHDRGYPVRIDLLIIYNRKKLVNPRKFNPSIKRNRKRWNIHLYRFKNRKNKKDALLGIVKILRK